VVWLYGATASLVSPFAKILPNLNLGGFVIDFTTLAALVVYSLVGYLLYKYFPMSVRDIMGGIYKFFQCNY